MGQGCGKPVATIEVNTTGGTVRGVDYGGGSQAFFGVRYAPLPARFSPSAPHTESWKGAQDATNCTYAKCWAPPAYPCLKPLANCTANQSATPMTEDCLKLDIYRPAPRADGGGAGGKLKQVLLVLLVLLVQLVLMLLELTGFSAEGNGLDPRRRNDYGGQPLHRGK